jgi:hypothetical protein
VVDEASLFFYAQASGHFLFIHGVLFWVDHHLFLVDWCLDGGAFHVD